MSAGDWAQIIGSAIAFSTLIGVIIAFAFKYTNKATGDIATMATEIHAINEMGQLTTKEHIETRRSIESLRDQAIENDRRTHEALGALKDQSGEADRRLWKKVTDMSERLVRVETIAINGGGRRDRDAEGSRR